jgi:serine/threonine protein kinase
MSDPEDPSQAARRNMDSEDAMRSALARARPTVATNLPIEKARIADALFGTVAASFGRFRVLEKLGQGGMGVVYAAYDPALDRGVALKLVRVRGRAQDAALAEAKALARLSHPNVVPIHDVGIEGDHIYIVMELVRGETLDRWVKGRKRKDVLAVYRQAGESLAAAHAAGLVHRDFKPANALMGTDGRVRVVDFGLACEATDPSSPERENLVIGGTPGYMAPEQAARAPVTPAADQYSFAVSLAEALAADETGRRVYTLPGWLQAIIERGRAPSAADRFSSMRELLRALSRDPDRLQRRRVVLAAVVAATAIAFVAGRSTLSAREEVCADGDERIEAAWPIARRTSALARLAQLSDYGKTLGRRLNEQLIEHSGRWSAAYRDACLSHRRGAQSSTLLDRRMACLERSRDALRSIAEIVQSTSVATLTGVAVAVSSLPEPGACGDLEALLAEVAPPAPAIAARVAEVRAGIADARIQVAAGLFDKASRLAEAAAGQARDVGHRPTLAEALLVQGHATMQIPGRRALAVPLLAEASTIGFEVGAYPLAVEAWARRAWAEGTLSPDPGVLAGLDVVQAVVPRGPAAQFARSLLYNNVGSIQLTTSHREQARASFQRALREAGGFVGPGSVELVNIRKNLALTANDADERGRLLNEAEEELTRLLGTNHPETLTTRWIRGAMTPSLGHAESILTPACEGMELHLPMLSASAVPCWTEVGFLRSELGQDDRAADAMARAVRAGAATTEDWPEAEPYLLMWQGETAAAARRFELALASLRRPGEEGRSWWHRFKVAKLELGFGTALRIEHQWRRAVRVLRSSVGALTEIARERKEEPPVQRRLERARAELARALAAAGGSRQPLTRASM